MLQLDLSSPSHEKANSANILPMSDWCVSALRSRISLGLVRPRKRHSMKHSDDTATR